MRKINNSGTVFEIPGQIPGQVCLGNSGIRQKKKPSFTESALRSTLKEIQRSFWCFSGHFSRKCKFKKMSKKCPKHPKKHRKHLSGFFNNVVEVLKKWSKFPEIRVHLAPFFPQNSRGRKSGVFGLSSVSGKSGVFSTRF
jgi:hypothetical protein